MYGWRARIGLILPVDNAVLEPELYAQRVGGVSFHAVRLTTEQRDDMPQQGMSMACVFPALEVNSIVYACAETSFLGGVDGNQMIMREVSSAGGAPAVTATWAMVEALRHLQAQRVSLLTPYTAQRGATMEGFLKRSGFEIAGSCHREFINQGVHSSEWWETNLQTPEAIYRIARGVDVRNADALLISATNVRTLEVITALEGALQVPVVTCNQAILWWCLTQAKVATTGLGVGSLLEEGVG
jgi:maleate cis-trans isomerase